MWTYMESILDMWKTIKHVKVNGRYKHMTFDHMNMKSMGTSKHVNIQVREDTSVQAYEHVNMQVY